MDDKNFSVWDLEKHQTKDTTDSHINGELTVVWRDWDNIIKNHPKMIYVNNINPREIKGPHIHKNRTTYFSCISGSIILVIQSNNGDMNALFGYTIQDRYIVGYSYDILSSDLSDYSTGSHEFMIGIRFVAPNESEIMQ